MKAGVGRLVSFCGVEFLRFLQSGNKSASAIFNPFRLIYGRAERKKKQLAPQNPASRSTEPARYRQLTIARQAPLESSDSIRACAQRVTQVGERKECEWPGLLSSEPGKLQGVGFLHQNITSVQRCAHRPPLLPLHSQRPFAGASGPSVTGLLVNCHTDFMTHGQII